MKKALGLAALLIVGAVIFLNRTTKENSLDAPGFAPVRDDALAKRYMPLIESGSSYGDPVAVYYRAAVEGPRTHITYHYVWEKEENLNPGFLPFLNRTIYTGGLRLQRKMFGPADIEKVSLVIRDGRVERAIFETAADYNPSAFGVSHKRIELDAVPAGFRVMSWNHLFEPVNTVTRPVAVEASYFTEDKWSEYEMVKLRETFLSRSRAHEPYERRAAP